LFECLYHTISVLVFIDDFKKINFKNSSKSKENEAVELSTSNAIVILVVHLLVFTYYSDSFGLMLWKQKFTLWLYLFPCFFGWVYAGNKTWTHLEETDG
jgi:hypothetical protein